MGEYDGSARHLSWPLLNPLVLSRTTEDDPECEGSSFVWPEDSDERVPVIFNLSLNEYTVLSSTIDVGSDIAYGVDAIRVWWLWTRNMRCSMSFCDMIIDAINTCPELQDELVAFIQNTINNVYTVQQAIVNVVLTDETIDDFIDNAVNHGSLSPDQRAQNMLNGSCDLGYLYNQVVTATDVLKNLKGNVFTAIYTGSTPLEQAQFLYALSPIFSGVFPSSMVLGFVAGALDTAGTAYDNAVSGGVEDRINCFLLDKIQCNCEMSIDRLLELYKRLSGLYIPPDPWEAFQAVANIIISGGLDDDHWFYAVNMLLLSAIRLNQTLLGIDFSQYAVAITASGDTSNDDYLTDCTSLGDPCDCENPANFFIGTVLEQDGLMYRVQSAGSNVIAWGQVADGGPICYLEGINAVEGSLTTGDLFLADGTPATFDALPAYIRYLAIGSFLGSMVYDWQFSE